MKPSLFPKMRPNTFLFTLIGISLFMVCSGLCILIFVIGGTLHEWVRALAHPIILSSVLGIFFGLLIRRAMSKIKLSNELSSKIKDTQKPEMKEMTIALFKVFGVIYVLFGGWGIIAFWHSNPKPLGEFVFFLVQFGVGLLTCSCTLLMFNKEKRHS